jgi:predicted alpha/beta-fold hydrolase
MKVSSPVMKICSYITVSSCLFSTKNSHAFVIPSQSSSPSSPSKIPLFISICSEELITSSEIVEIENDESILMEVPKSLGQEKASRQFGTLFFADEVHVCDEQESKSKDALNGDSSASKSLDISSKHLMEEQMKSKPIISTFQPKTFNPHPLLTNEHLQTILGVFIREEPGCAYIDPKASNIVEEILPVVKAIYKKMPIILGLEEGKESECSFWDEREMIRTDDGDFFDVDFKYVKNSNLSNEKQGKGTVILVHGLESNSNSTVSTNMAKSFISQGFDVACINHRGCSGRPNDSMVLYHAGFTKDLIQLIQILSERNRNENSSENIKPLYLSGFSLGSNIVMKCLGELSLDAATKYDIQGAAVTAAPFHLREHYKRLSQERFQRTVYAGTVLKSMRKKADILLDRLCDGDTNTKKFDYRKVKNAKTIPEVEDGLIVPVFGFKDYLDYYDKSASLPLIDKIAVPTFVLNAADDPFFSETFFPWDLDSERGGVAPLKLVKTEKGGGHLGHLFHQLSEEEKEKFNVEYPVTSFALSELGRFLHHVHTENK